MGTICFQQISLRISQTNKNDKIHTYNGIDSIFNSETRDGPRLGADGDADHHLHQGCRAAELVVMSMTIVTTINVETLFDSTTRSVRAGEICIVFSRGLALTCSTKAGNKTILFRKK